MIDREHELTITKQAKILNISRGSVYYLPRPVESNPTRSTCALTILATDRSVSLSGCTWTLKEAVPDLTLENRL